MPLALCQTQCLAKPDPLGPEGLVGNLVMATLVVPLLRKPTEFSPPSGERRRPAVSQPELAMRAQAYQFETVVIRLAVDKDEVRSDVAVAMIAPFA